MSYLKAVAIAVATVSLGSVSLWTSGAAAQESAVEFNRQEWLRRSGAVAPTLAAPTPTKPKPPPAARQVVVRQPPPQAAPPRDFFSALFGPRYEPEPEVERQRIIITPGRRPEGPESGEGYGKASGGVGSYAFCVRTCDGRYFPLQGRPAPGSEGAALAQCNSFCPAAQMDVYFTHSSDKAIDSAVNTQGKPYTSLATAFVFRERLVPDCTCTADGRVGGMQRIDVRQDPTLKRGDIVMTASGAKVFAASGKAKPPFRDRDFVAPERFPELPPAMRKRIAELSAR
ncbi:DUF2865 domain-containing protein [Xanthobacter sp. KR7-225]|uniref:DUF2865 domain-containing protein n=1 Tax=Xanthobacter sp. KR7-225 TaxID=3156613 RepID=UPI0032B38709